MVPRTTRLRSLLRCYPSRNVRFPSIADIDPAGGRAERLQWVEADVRRVVHKQMSGRADRMRWGQTCLVSLSVVSNLEPHSVGIFHEQGPAIAEPLQGRHLEPLGPHRLGDRFHCFLGRRREPKVV